MSLSAFETYFMLTLVILALIYCKGNIFTALVADVTDAILRLVLGRRFDLVLSDAFVYNFHIYLEMNHKDHRSGNSYIYMLSP
jgi:hypothetical protein